MRYQTQEMVTHQKFNIGQIFWTIQHSIETTYWIRLLILLKEKEQG